MFPSNVCQRCGLGEETLLHCVRDCQASLNLWNALGFGTPDFFLMMDVQCFLRKGISEPRGKLFMAGTWWAWRVRNMQCFGEDKVPLPRLIMLVKSMAGSLEVCFPSQMSLSRQERWIKWHEEGDLALILNVDGSNLGNPGRAGFGGIIRNWDGSWITGFAEFIGIYDILHVELLAVLHGLRLAWDRGFQNLICYSDSMNGISLLRDPLPLFHKYAVLVQEIRICLQMDWTAVIRHTLREGNQCPDFMAKLGASNDDEYVIHEDPPQGIACLLNADRAGVLFRRS